MKTNPLITRRQTRQIMVGNIPVGGGAPISVQTMTNTETCDVDATLVQINNMVREALILSAFPFRVWTRLRPSEKSVHR